MGTFGRHGMERLRAGATSAVGADVAAPGTASVTPTVFVVDDDDEIRRSMRWLLESVGRRVETFNSAEAFLAAHTRERTGCLLLDVRMPGMGGARLMEMLVQAGDPLPIIFLSAHGDVPLAVRVIKGGAMEFLQKPCNQEQLLETVNRAIDLDQRRRQQMRRRSDIDARMATLTSREREILDLVVAGLSNKLIARDLGISPKTVETHRGRVMLKMGAASVAELVRTCIEASGQDPATNVKDT